ncbi:AbrB/MazE/SpoVT family DNA-binding domain-containing protein [Candidatus Woesearchaeota archaeon]|nr:AbrB/MazE/SpoVT family DNA-binding domain-containing protein [Candidatus Woesearchaeota archaeon]
MIVTVSKGQQITIPADIRAEFGLHVGSKVEVEHKKGRIIIKPVGDDIETVFKLAKKIKPKVHLTAEQMDELNEGLFR